MDITRRRDGAAALSALEEVLGGSRGMLVAFSGGVDSSVLLAVANQVLGPARVVAFTADSPSMPRRELAAAVAFTKDMGVRHLIRATAELQRNEYRQNDASRCYWCKHTLFEECETTARQVGVSEIAYGFTADDLADYRPGHRAATEFGVRAPLLDARLTKQEVRAIAKHLGHSVWDKPAAPCLSSRIPYGSPVSEDKLARIEAMEELLHDLGFRVCRARFDGQEMRIELERHEIERAAASDVQEQIRARALSLQIESVTLDRDGFRSGKLNAGLTA